MIGFLETIGSALSLTVVLSALSLLAVWIPFRRGIVLCRRARRATRRVANPELGQRRSVAGDGPEPLALLLLRVIEGSLRDLRRSGASEPRAFVIDAARQYAENEYDKSYARPISMHANILPPIGFIGTTAGMLILFFSMRVSSASLEIGALALALTSSLFALVGFAILESSKIRLYGRLDASLDHALSRVPSPAPDPAERPGPRRGASERAPSERRARSGE